MTEHFDDEKDEIIDGDITEKNDDHGDDSDYEKFCFLCHRPESQAGKMIEPPNNIHICNDCMQKSFDTTTRSSLPSRRSTPRTTSPPASFWTPSRVLASPL